MTYLRILRLLDAVLRPLERRTGIWTFTDWRGRLAFRQIDYAKRVQKASGWESVTIAHQSGPTVTNTGMAGNATHRYTFTTGVR